MSAIDVDAHVHETERTFDYFDPEFERFKPWGTVKKSEDVQFKANDGTDQKEFWVIDGRLLGKEGNISAETTKEMREMENIDARLNHMTELEIDVQVLYPTVFLRPVTKNPWVEYALYKSYNRWLADIWKVSPDKLKWAVMPPLMMLDKAEEEIRFGKDHGAVGIFLRGGDLDRQADNPYFFRIYELAQELDMPVCYHASTGSFTVYETYRHGGLPRGKLPVVAVCSQLLQSDIPAKFPGVRWGIIEVTAQWIPYVLNDLELRWKRQGRKLSPTVLADNNIFVACQVTDDIGYVLDYAGEDQIVVGTDYGHADTSTEIEMVRRPKTEGKVSPAAADKILYHNAKALYGI